MEVGIASLRVHTRERGIERIIINEPLSVQVIKNFAKRHIELSSSPFHPFLQKLMEIVSIYKGNAKSFPNEPLMANILLNTWKNKTPTVADFAKLFNVENIDQLSWTKEAKLNQVNNITTLDNFQPPIEYSYPDKTLQSFGANNTPIHCIVTQLQTTFRTDAFSIIKIDNNRYFSVQASFKLYDADGFPKEITHDLKSTNWNLFYHSKSGEKIYEKSLEKWNLTLKKYPHLNHVGSLRIHSYLELNPKNN